MIKKTPLDINLSNPRHAAYTTLLKLSEGSLHADELMDRELSTNRLNGLDRGLYSNLVFGVLRRQGTIDHYLTQLVNQPLNRLEKQVLLLLRLGLYQLAYLDRVPPHAAVNETVELAKAALPRASGLINGVLRNFLRKQNTLTLPDPKNDPLGHLSAAHSVPSWLLQQWQTQLPPEDLEPLAAASSMEPLLTLRTNTLKISRDDLLALLAGAEIQAEPCLISPQGIKLYGHPAVTELPGFGEGFFAVQDEASQIVSLLLDPQPGELLLDACAAPGGKTLHLAQLMNNSGAITATDLTEKKLGLVRESADRLGITIVRTLVADASEPDYLKGEQFDRILLDAPCSGLGVIRRNPEAKWRLQPADFERYAAKQRLILKNIAPLLKPGGKMVYATCSTSPLEDEAVVDDFLSQHKEFVVETGLFFADLHSDLLTAGGAVRLWPHRHTTDGFFAVGIRRKAP